jgi:alpha-1,2-mannosyltransferase
VVLWPWTWLSTRSGEWLWLTLSVVATAAFFALMVSVLPTSSALRRLGPLVVAAAMWAVPMRMTFWLGQINAFVALPIMVDVVLLARHRRRAGMGIGLATALKVTPGLLIVWLALSGRWTAARNAVVAFAAATIVAAAIEPRGTREYFTDVLFATESVAGGTNDPWNGSLRHFIWKLELPGALQSVVWLVCAAGIAGVAVWAAVQLDRRDEWLAAVALVMTATYVVSPISWTHHMWFVIPALAALATSGIRALQVFAAVAVIPWIDWWTTGTTEKWAAWRLVTMLAIVAACAWWARVHARSHEPDASPVG